MKKVIILFVMVVTSSVTLFLYQNITPFSPSTSLTAPSCPTLYGANFNKEPETIRRYLIETRLNPSWFRGIIDVLDVKKALDIPMGNKNKMEAMQRIQKKLNAFKDAKRIYKMKTIVSLKFDYVKFSLRLPLAQSAEEKAVQQVVRYIVESLKDDLDIIVSGNEPIVESLPIDFQFEAGLNRSRLDFFYKRMTRFVNNLLGDSSNIKIYVGSFNRLDVPLKRDFYGVQEMLRFALESHVVDGIDLHIHVPHLAAFREQLEYIRARIQAAGTGKKLIVTEFSFMWLFKQHLSDNLCESEHEASFCDQIRNLPYIGDIFQQSVVRELDFINRVLQAPNHLKLPAAVYAEFFRSRSYLQFDLIRESYRLLNEFGVGVAAYNFDQNDVNDPATWQWKGSYTLEDTTPRLYALYVPQSVIKLNTIPVNEYLFHPFKRIVDRINTEYFTSPEKMNTCDFAPLPM